MQFDILTGQHEEMDKLLQMDRSSRFIIWVERDFKSTRPFTISSPNVMDCKERISKCLRQKAENSAHFVDFPDNSTDSLSWRVTLQRVKGMSSDKYQDSKYPILAILKINAKDLGLTHFEIRDAVFDAGVEFTPRLIKSFGF
jgi:hypothetical protein